MNYLPLLCFSFLFIYGNDAVSVNIDINRFCHSDPTVRYWRNLTCPLGQHLVTVPYLNPNPFHAFHDTGWAVGYYLYNCLQRANETHLWVNSTSDIDLRLCWDEKSPHVERSKQPSWGICLLKTVALNRGIPLQNFHLGREPPAKCWRRETVINGRFRQLVYKAISTRLWFWDILVPWKMRKEAVQRIASDVSASYYKETFEYEERNTFHVLVYTRDDVRRRRWNNVNETISLLEKDPDFTVKKVYGIPTSLRQQVNLFRDADIVITPHGAALANSIFMRKHSTILEVHKCCFQEIRTHPHEFQRWTSWHVRALSLNIRYIQCHVPGTVLSIQQLRKKGTKQDEDQGCSFAEFDVEPKEVMEMITQMKEIMRKQMKKKKKRKIPWPFALSFLVLIFLFVKLHVIKGR